MTDKQNQRQIPDEKELMKQVELKVIQAIQTASNSETARVASENKQLKDENGKLKIEIENLKKTIKDKDADIKSLKTDIDQAQSKFEEKFELQRKINLFDQNDLRKENIEIK